MIVALVREKSLVDAVLAAASPEEDVFFGVGDGLEALYHGFPRLLILSDRRASPPSTHVGVPDVPVLRIGTESTSGGWWRRGDVPLQGRMTDLIGEVADSGSWVDDLFGAMAAASGVGLPRAFRGFCRRVLEHPAHYVDLHAMARLTGLSRGALKARFRRRGLRSPAEHIRWLRVLAAGQVLGGAAITTVEAAYRLGYTSDGNLCRVTQTVADVSPAGLRDPIVRTRLLLGFVQRFVLDPDLGDRWSRFEPIFFRTRVA
jgi:AraC-like DNA-binding protein